MKITKTEKILSGKFINIFRKFFVTESGKQGLWEYVEYPDPKKRAVAVFAMTKDKEVILERIFRVPRGECTIELPAGSSDQENETEMEAAKRELLEETGFASKEVIQVFEGVLMPGLVNLNIVYFFAPDAEFVGKRGGEDEEEIEVLKVPLDNLVDYILEQSKVTGVADNILGILPILQKKKLI
ncbi:MAG: NUDIX hydrolase [Candidatus Pacebacteria bacterium]|nr:NUDIX hydrolase [Candidatus Paceibacterota bacterium]